MNNKIDHALRLIPMDEAPKDGTNIIVKTVHPDEGNKYRLCKWVKPYSNLTACGAWQYIENNTVLHITDRNAYGWLPQPKSA